VLTLKELTSAATSRLAVPAISAASDFELTDAGMLDQESLRVGKFLRHLLRMIVVEPDGARAPREAIQRLRPFVDRARAGLQDAGETESAARKLARARAQLLEGAMAGLCHVARFCAGAPTDSIVPPFAVAGVDIQMRHPSESSPLDVLFIVSENSQAQEQADRMISFVLIGLSDLGFSANYATCMPSDAVRLSRLVPGFTLTADKLHYEWGSFSLYERLTGRLPANDHLPGDIGQKRADLANAKHNMGA
jgi:hypothetical protein